MLEAWSPFAPRKCARPYQHEAQASESAIVEPNHSLALRASIAIPQLRLTACPTGRAPEAWSPFAPRKCARPYQHEAQASESATIEPNHSLALRAGIAIPQLRLTACPTGRAPEAWSPFAPRKCARPYQHEAQASEFAIVEPNHSLALRASIAIPQLRLNGGRVLEAWSRGALPPRLNDWSRSSLWDYQRRHSTLAKIVELARQQFRQ
ncbi:hypothetical protein EC9_16690 [Rosistilla ulvae]|uniref:Uncharacterized protein n=1 Tax=Rosistilla ulvae TaxID=1930277 RepID=A0A517LXZ5_9BACT|nr:hypothetical protein EC9_16690 [Rosistilla ulvae]